MDKYLKIFIYILDSLILLSLGAFGFWIYQEKIAEEAEISVIPLTVSSPIPESTISDNWKVYKNEVLGFEISYPSNKITISQEGNKIKLSHSISHEHPDPCEFRDNMPLLKFLTDLNVSIEVANKDLGAAVIINEGDYLASNILPDNKLKIEPNFIDEFNIDSLKGYQITTGVEGCGRLAYYFPLTSNKTLIVIRSFITEFNPIVLDYQEYLELPGIIPPNEEENLFNKILSSFKFMN